MNYLKPVVQTTFFVVAGRSAAFLLPLTIGAMYGANQETDAFLLVYSLFFAAISLFGDAPRLLIPPFLAERIDDPPFVSRFLNSLLASAALFLFSLWILGVYFLPPILSRISSLDSRTIMTARDMVLFGGPFVIAACANQIVGGFLNFYRIFWLPAVMPVFSALAAFLILPLLRTQSDLKFVYLIFSLAEGAVFLGLTAYLKRKYQLRSQNQGKRFENAARFWKTTFFHTAALALSLLNPIMAELWASQWGAGSISLVQYASSIYFAVYGALGIGLGTVLVSYWSVLLVRAEDGAKLRAEGIRTALWTLAVTVPVCLVVYILGGILPAWKVEMTAVFELVQVYIWAVVPAVAAVVLTRVFIVTKKTYVITAASVVQALVNFLMLYVVFPSGGLRVAAWSCVSYMTAAFAALLISAWWFGPKKS